MADDEQEGGVGNDYPAPGRPIKGQTRVLRYHKPRLEQRPAFGLYLRVGRPPRARRASERVGMNTSQPRSERLAMMLGIMVSLIGGLIAAAGAWSMNAARQFQAAAVRTTAKVVPSGHPHGAVRFTTENGQVVESSMRQGHKELVGSTLPIMYERVNPHHWVIESEYEPGHGLAVTAVGAGIIVGGVVVLA